MCFWGIKEHTSRSNILGLISVEMPLLMASLSQAMLDLAGWMADTHLKSSRMSIGQKLSSIDTETNCG